MFDKILFLLVAGHNTQNQNTQAQNAQDQNTQDLNNYTN